jgi:2-(3-amino-3-carboxypropyl)histidine synthase
MSSSEGAGMEEKAAPKRRYAGRSAAAAGTDPSNPQNALTVKKSGGATVVAPAMRSLIPETISHHAELNAAISAALPSNYNFEIHKTIWRLREARVERVALQFPEGLLLFSCLIADILRKFTYQLLPTDATDFKSLSLDVVILGDVTYGACCIDDFTARALGCSMMVHYGHSCLIPVTQMGAVPVAGSSATSTPFQTLYVFVDISIDVEHFVQSVFHNIPSKDSVIAVVGTIQFAAALQASAALLRAYYGASNVIIPQSRPLSPGEILGCTSPQLAQTVDALIYLGDGRFHLESIMISNPDLLTYRYDPYSKVISIEQYDTPKMHHIRQSAVQTASRARKVGIILGTLGRQGSPHILTHIQENLTKRGTPYITVLMSEIFPNRLKLFEDVEAWVQIACPRLSIDWGAAFTAPLLNPYEAEVAFGEQAWKPVYPMDFYSRDGGSWSVYTAAKQQQPQPQKKSSPAS